MEFLQNIDKMNIKNNIKRKKFMKKVVKFKKLNPDAIIPDYSHEGDAGMDLYSIQDEIIEPLSWKVIPTGLACALPVETIQERCQECSCQSSP